jgi:hypothetical protein
MKDPSIISTSLANRSSVHHNILTGEVNSYSHKVRVSPAAILNKMANRQKGITDLFNL